MTTNIDSIYEKIRKIGEDNAGVDIGYDKNGNKCIKRTKFLRYGTV